MKVRMGLRVKGMPDATISQALEYIPEKEYAEALKKVLLAKARSLDLRDVKDRQKLYRHLASRGFESNQIISAMREMMKHRNETNTD